MLNLADRNYQGQQEPVQSPMRAQKSPKKSPVRFSIDFESSFNLSASPEKIIQSPTKVTLPDVSHRDDDENQESEEDKGTDAEETNNSFHLTDVSSSVEWSNNYGKELRILKQKLLGKFSEEETARIVKIMNQDL